MGSKASKGPCFRDFFPVYRSPRWSDPISDENLELDVGGNLKVASLQDRSRSKSNSVGVSGGSSSGGSSAGFNASMSRGKRKWVSEQTALLGGNVNINVANHTELKGAKIAAVDENGNDNGNLSLTTQSLSYEDIRNRDKSTNMSASVNVSESDVVDKDGKPKKETSTGGSIGFGFSDKTAISKATIGLGTIKVGNENDPKLQGLNRNIEVASLNIKDTGSQMTLDDATLNVMLNPIESLTTIKDDVLQLKSLAQVAVEVIDIKIDEEKREKGGKDATTEQMLDAIADGFTVVNSLSKKLREKSKNTEDLKTTETQDAQTAQNTVNANFNDILHDLLVEEEKTIKLTSYYGLEERFLDYENHLGATDEKSGQSFLLFDQQKVDFTQGSHSYQISTAEALRQKFKLNPLYDEDNNRNDGFETLVERAIAKSVAPTWEAFSDETPTRETEWFEINKSNYAKKYNLNEDEDIISPAQLWIENNGNEDFIKTNTRLLDITSPINVKAYDDPGFGSDSNDFVGNSAAKSVGYGIGDRINNASYYTSQLIYQPIEAVLELNYEATALIDSMIYQPKQTLSTAAVNLIETPGNVSNLLNYNFYRATNDFGDYLGDLYDQQVDYMSEGTYVKDMTKLAIGFYTGKNLLKVPGTINREVMEARLNRGIPQGFNSRNFAQFKFNVESLIEEAKLPKGTLEIQGSRVKGNAATTSDIDVILRVDKEAFEKFAAQRIDSVHAGTKLQKALIKAAEKEKLSKFDISKEFARKIYEKVVPGSPVKNIDFSIVVEGSKYDTGPFLPIGD